MAEEMVDQSPAAGGGGLDGDVAGFDEVDDQGLMTPQGPVETFDEPEEADEPDDGDWTADLPEDLREKVGGKYRSPADLARAYASAEERIGDFRNEIGALRDEIARIAVNGGPQHDAPTADDGPQLPDQRQVSAYVNDVARQMDEGNVDVGAGVAAIVEALQTVNAAHLDAVQQRFQRQLEETVDARTAPLEEQAYTTEVGREITAIRREMGDEAYRQHYEQAARTLEQWERTEPGFVRNPRAIRAAFQDSIYRAQIQQRRESEAEVLQGTGGRPRRGPSPAELIIREMDEISGPASFGGLD